MHNLSFQNVTPSIVHGMTRNSHPYGTICQHPVAIHQLYHKHIIRMLVAMCLRIALGSVVLTPMDIIGGSTAVDLFRSRVETNLAKLRITRGTLLIFPEELPFTPGYSR